MIFRRKDLIYEAIRQRFVVTLAGKEGTFSGVLTECDATYWVFDDCATVPDKPADAPKPIAGRIWVKHGAKKGEAAPPYPPTLQEVNA